MESQVRLHGVTVEDEAVDTFAKRPVAKVLNIGWMTQSALGVAGNEGFIDSKSAVIPWTVGWNPISC